MQKKIIIWSVIGAIAISALCPEPSEAQRRGGFRRGNRSGLVQRRRAKRPYYKTVSLIAQVDRSGVTRPVQQRRQPQAERDERFPIRPEPNIRREAQSNVDQAKADSLRNYAKDQPDYAMRNLLGKPSRSDSNSDVYDIKGSGSPYQASRRLVINYRWSTACNCRVGNSHQE